MKNIGDYHNLYVQSDVLSGIDILEDFRYTCLKTYNLDPGKNYSALGLVWIAVLKNVTLN